MSSLARRAPLPLQRGNGASRFHLFVQPCRLNAGVHPKARRLVAIQRFSEVIEFCVPLRLLDTTQISKTRVADFAISHSGASGPLLLLSRGLLNQIILLKIGARATQRYDCTSLGPCIASVSYGFRLLPETGPGVRSSVTLICAIIGTHGEGITNEDVLMANAVFVRDGLGAVARVDVGYGLRSRLR